jgi:hypothetical protein
MVGTNSLAAFQVCRGLAHWLRSPTTSEPWRTIPARGHVVKSDLWIRDVRGRRLGRDPTRFDIEHMFDRSAHSQLELILAPGRWTVESSLDNRRARAEGLLFVSPGPSTTKTSTGGRPTNGGLRPTLARIGLRDGRAGNGDSRGARPTTFRRARRAWPRGVFAGQFDSVLARATWAGARATSREGSVPGASLPGGRRSRPEGRTRAQADRSSATHRSRSRA